MSQIHTEEIVHQRGAQRWVSALLCGLVIGIPGAVIAYSVFRMLLWPWLPS